MSIRPLLAALLLAIVLPVAAQQSKPPVLQPLPEQELDPTLEPQVTIQKRGTDTVEEYRINGRLYMIKITPARGAPYYMVDQAGNGTFARQDNYDSGIRPPMWVIFQF